MYQREEEYLNLEEKYNNYVQKACFKNLVTLQKYCVSFFPNLYKQFCVVQGVPGRPGHPGPAGAKGEKVFLLFNLGTGL